MAHRRSTVPDHTKPPGVRKTVDWLDEQSGMPPGGLSDDQRRIWKVFLRALATALRKNNDYGSSVFTPPTLAPDVGTLGAILVRMGDKIKRIQALRTGRERMVADERLNDTMGDLGTYCFLYLAADDLLGEVAFNRRAAARAKEGLTKCNR